MVHSYNKSFNNDRVIWGEKQQKKHEVERQKRTMSVKLKHFDLYKWESSDVLLTISNMLLLKSSSK